MIVSSFREPALKPKAQSQPAPPVRVDAFQQQQTSEDGFWSSMGHLAKEALGHILGPRQTPESGLPPAAVTPGQIDYYRKRNEDFKLRHPELKPPSYYMGYGDKYAHRFLLTTRPEMTPQGQQWMDRTFLNLQVAMENERIKDPAAFNKLEEDSKAFRHFAFGTHPKAYLDAGLADLPTSDLILIAGTPDTKDLWSKDGRDQVEQVAAQIFADHGIDFLKEKANDWVHHPLDSLGSVAVTTLHHAEHLGTVIAGAGHKVLQWLLHHKS